MKKVNVLISSLMILSAFILTNCSGYIVATGPPAPPSEVIIEAPSVYHVWIPGHYVYRSGAYVWIKGYYKVPPRGKAYVPGRWEKTGKGYKHHKGHWKKNH